MIAECSCVAVFLQWACKISFTLMENKLFYLTLLKTTIYSINVNNVIRQIYRSKERDSPILQFIKVFTVLATKRNNVFRRIQRTEKYTCRWYTYKSSRNISCKTAIQIETSSLYVMFWRPPNREIARSTLFVICWGPPSWEIARSINAFFRSRITRIHSHQDQHWSLGMREVFQRW